MRVIRLASLLVALATVGCASGGSSGVRSGRTTNVITADEIAGRSESNAYDLIQVLRPDFLRARGSTLGGGTGSRGRGGRGSSGDAGTIVALYADMRQLAGVDELRAIRRGQIQEIRYYTPSDATSKFGQTNTTGAVQVVLRH